MIAVAHFPASLDQGPLERLRRPLAAIAALLLAIDVIVLGLHLVDAQESPFAGDTSTPARARIGGPEAVVPGSDVLGAQARRGSAATRPVEPFGCLAAASGCYAGPQQSPPAGGDTQPGKTPAPPTTPPPPTPVAQADIAVPALGAQVSLGVGDGGCTTVDLTVIALGDCPATTGDGPVVVNLGGTLLGD